MAPVLLLTGFMGSGKSTVGREVARRQGWKFIDLDRQIVAESGMDIPSIFQDEGETGFRRWESNVLRNVLEQASSGESVVVALGGGALVDPANRALVKGRAIVAYLEVDCAEAWARVHRSDRPLAKDRGEFELLFESRRSTYEEAADLTICSEDRSIGDTVDKIISYVVARCGGER
ncbi:MAG: shikimate kinase [Actinobacteria bacterium]|nr:shikimate kinase [Actinomycetota bacterium]